MYLNLKKKEKKSRKKKTSKFVTFKLCAVSEVVMVPVLTRNLSTPTKPTMLPQGPDSIDWTCPPIISFTLVDMWIQLNHSMRLSIYKVNTCRMFVFRMLSYEYYDNRVWINYNWITNVLGCFGIFRKDTIQCRNLLHKIINYSKKCLL